MIIRSFGLLQSLSVHSEGLFSCPSGTIRTPISQESEHGYQISALLGILASKSKNALTLIAGVRTPFEEVEYLLNFIDLQRLRFQESLAIDFDITDGIEGLKDYLVIQLPDKKVLTLSSMGRLLYRLPTAEFIRLHQS
ncbi:LytTR family transcriptional regulator [Pontibacter sp. SGAir0037]|uniref:LytTR family transcriptional regulator n=1 Tax=Pontibacter sp. SGAir0037 TaxID=2571030 RepID=UPI0010CD4E74|nr:LytTR family transcriptional regulator [Pontibacter sp. SGAir0037]QCR22762.1 hypothetical protein C1N53_10670 [Pontibacter sp. SGAir0037]